MKKNVINRTTRLFASILLPFMVGTIFIILILTSLLYFNCNKIVTDMVNKSAISNLENISNSASMMRQTAKSLSNSAFFDDKVANMLYGDLNVYDYSSHIRKLDSYKNIYPFLNSIYVYNGHNFYASPSKGFIYERDSFYDIDIVKMMGDMKKYKSNSFIARKMPNTTENSINDNREYKYVYTYLFYDSQLHSGRISEAIILNLSEELLKGNIRQFDRDNQVLYVVDDKGNLMLGNSKYSMLTNLNDKNYIMKILTQSQKTGFMRAEVEGVDSFITYVSEDSLNWKFISVSPYNLIMVRVNNLQKLTYTIAGIILVVGVLLSLFISRRIYIPMISSVDKVDALEMEIKSDLYSNKQEFLNKLIKYNYFYSNNLEVINTNMKKYNITINLSEPLLLILCKIDKFNDFCDKYNAFDRSLMKFGIMNILSELLTPFFKNENVDIGDDYTIVLLNYNKKIKPSSDNELINSLLDIQKNVSIYLDISLSFSFVEAFNSVDLLSTYFSKTVDLAFFKYTIGHKCIVFPETLDLAGGKEYSHPIDMEKKMVNELMLGHIPEAKEVLERILRDVAVYGRPSFHMSILHIIVALNETIKTFRKNANTEASQNFSLYISKLEKAEIIDETLDIFFEAFDEIFNEVENNKTNKNEKLVDSVIKIIDSNYMDENLTTNKVSEMVGITPAYLGRLFRNRTALSITDYTNRVRIEKSKELLLSTDESINNIMIKAGFISRSHFYAAFKKELGVSPSQFRQSKKRNN